MAVSNGGYLKRFHEATWSQGDKAVSSDFTFVIDGFEDSYLRCKQFPFPQLSSGEPVEISSVLGTQYTQAGQVEFYRQGSIAFYETVLGLTDNLLINLIANGGEFDAWVYHGTMENYIWKRRIVKCHAKIENPDLDWENRTQPLLLTGNLHFHYYGEEDKGNVPILRGNIGGV